MQNIELLYGIAAALGSAASWAIGAFLFQRLGETLSPLAMTLLKGAIAVVFLGLALMIVGVEEVSGEALQWLILSGLLGIAIADSCFFESLNHLGPQTMLVLAVLGQVFTIILAMQFLGERPAPVAFAGIALVIAGVAIVLYGSLAQDQTKTAWRGLVFGLISVVSMAVSSILAKKAMGDDAHTLQVTFIRMLAGTLGILLIGIVSGRLGRWVMPFREPGLLVFFLSSVAVVTFGGFWLSMVAFKFAPVSVAATLTSTEPVFGLGLTAVIGRERIKWSSVVGTIVVVAGAIMLCAPEWFVTTPY